MSVTVVYGAHGADGIRCHVMAATLLCQISKTRNKKRG